MKCHIILYTLLILKLIQINNVNGSKLPQTNPCSRTCGDSVPGPKISALDTETDNCYACFNNECEFVKAQCEFPGSKFWTFAFTLSKQDHFAEYQFKSYGLCVDYNGPCPVDVEPPPVIDPLEPIDEDDMDVIF